MAPSRRAVLAGLGATLLPAPAFAGCLGLQFGQAAFVDPFQIVVIDAFGHILRRRDFRRRRLHPPAKAISTWRIVAAVGAAAHKNV